MVSVRGAMVLGGEESAPYVLEYTQKEKKMICHKCGKTIEAEDYVHIERRFPSGQSISPGYPGYIVSEWDVCNLCWHDWVYERNVSD
jgi:hypothetical protein